MSGGFGWCCWGCPGDLSWNGAIGDGSWTSQASPSEPSAVCLRFVGFGGIGRNRASALD